MSGEEGQQEQPDKQNLKLARCNDAVSTAQTAIDTVMPTGLSPALAITSVLSASWESPAAEEFLEGITSQGTTIKAGFDDALADLQRAQTREAREPMVPHDDPRGNRSIYPPAGSTPLGAP